MDEIKHTKKSAGQLGGQATVQKHGKEHMKQIGKRGAQVTWSRYSLKPIGTSQYAMVYRETGEIKVIF